MLHFHKMRSTRFSLHSKWLLSAILLITALGCRTTAPIYVWKPPAVEIPRNSKIAIAPLIADPILGGAIQMAMLEQRPAIRADLAVLTEQQLLEASPVRLASTASFLSDLTALQAAQSLGADLLICGQVYSSDIDWTKEASSSADSTKNMNQVFLQRMSGTDVLDPEYHLLMSWNLMRVSTGQSIGSEQFTIHSHEVLERYPDLQHLADQPATLLVTAAARETWRSVAPSVSKETVQLAVPWLQPGAIRTQLGVRAAKKGQWNIAAEHWRAVASRWWLPSPAASHNLAIAEAAKEDFAAARSHLENASGWRNIGLPIETPIWLDYQQRRYHQAHGLEPPEKGWLFPSSAELQNHYGH
jgi:hypothetical protein